MEKWAKFSPLNFLQMEGGGGAVRQMKRARSALDRVLHLGVLSGSLMLTALCIGALFRRAGKMESEMSEMFLEGYGAAFRKIVQENSFRAAGADAVEYIRYDRVLKGKVRNIKNPFGVMHLVASCKQRNPFMFSFTFFINRLEKIAEIAYDRKDASVLPKEKIYKHIQSYFSGRADACVYKRVCDATVQFLAENIEPSALFSNARLHDPCCVTRTDYEVVALLVGSISNGLIGEKVGYEDLCARLGIDYNLVAKHPIFVQFQWSGQLVADQQ